jgi:hypothetical protein
MSLTRYNPAMGWYRLRRNTYLAFLEFSAFHQMANLVELCGCDDHSFSCKFSEM